jgi:arsenate reductase
MTGKKKTILFVCIQNSGRSQMAEAFFNKSATGKARGISAGTQPADRVNPTMVKAMGEVGIDISEKKPKMLTLEMIEGADMMITMGCGADAGGLCPANIIESEDWQLEDPKDKPIEKVRKIRDEIEIRVNNLIEKLSL